MRADPADIDRRYQAACERGDTIACSPESWRGASGPEPELTRAFFTPLCDCLYAGQARRDGIGVPHDPTAAFALFRTSCEASFGPRCAAMGRGIGRRLVDTCIDVVRESAHSMRLYADRPSEGFYRRLGASRVGEESSRVPGGPVFPVMEFTW